MVMPRLIFFVPDVNAGVRLSLAAAHTETDALARLSKATVDSGVVAAVVEDSVLGLACGHRRFSHFICL